MTKSISSKVTMLIMALLLMFSVSVQAQEQKKDNPSDTSSLSYKEVYRDVKSVISSLAESLKVGTEHVYEVLVRQQVVNAITWLFVYAIFITGCIIWYRKVDKWWDDCSSSDQGGLMFACFAIGLTTLIVILWNIETVVTGFVNPEYGAIKQIIELLHR